MSDTSSEKSNNDDLDTYLEMDYLNLDQCFLSIFCGIKGSSKTYTNLNLLKYYYLRGSFNTVHFISPSWKIDNNQEQYEFLRYIDKKKMTVYMYDKYSPHIIERILNMHSDKKNRVLVIIDDSTSAGKEISMDENFLYFVTTSRHLGIFINLICHNLKKVLSPTIRSMCDFFFLYRVINAKLLQAFYEEYLSVFDKWNGFKEFKSEYYNRILKSKYNGLFLDCRESRIDWNIKGWNINEYDFPEFKQMKQNTHIKDIHIDKEKDEILRKLEKKEKVEELKRKIMMSKKK